MNEPLLEAYPLTWPEGRPRTPPSRQKQGQFQVSFAEARQDLLHELSLLGAREVVISSWVKLRNDGLPRAGDIEPQDPGIALYFKRKNKPFVIACDTYNRVKQNLRAIGLTIKALRTIERHGSTQMMEQAFTGFAQLPAHLVEQSWWDTLGVSPGASIGQIEDAHRELAIKHHPDRGGDQELMARINRARDIALQERG